MFYFYIIKSVLEVRSAVIVGGGSPCKLKVFILPMTMYSLEYCGGVSMHMSSPAVS